MKTKTNAVEEINDDIRQETNGPQVMVQSWQGKFYAEKKAVNY